MKIYIAYALIVICIPYLAGTFISMILTFPVSLSVRFVRQLRGNKETTLEALEAISHEPMDWLVGDISKMALGDRIAHFCHDLFRGLGSVFAAAIIFYFFNLPLSVWVIHIIVVWEIYFFFHPKQKFRVLLGSLLGVYIGWFIALQLF